MSDETTRKPDDPRPEAPQADEPQREPVAPETAPEPPAAPAAAPEAPAAPAAGTAPPRPPAAAPAAPATQTGGSGGAAPPPAGGQPALAPYGGGHGSSGGYGGPGGYGGDPNAPYKPSKVTTMAVIDLVDGILNVLIGIGWVFGGLVFGLGTAGCGCFIIPLGAYPLILGVLEIVYASQLLPARPRNVGVARWLAVMQIIAVLYGQIVSVVAGVLKLVFAEDPEVRDYLARTQATPPAGGSGYGA